MTVTVNFKINQETKKLEVTLDNDSENANELAIGKRILGMATQLNFVSLPAAKGFDVGGAIVVEAEEYPEDDEWDEDFYEDSANSRFEREEFDLDEFDNKENVHCDIVKTEQTIEDVADIITEEELIQSFQAEITVDKTRTLIEEMEADGQSIGWKDGDTYVNVMLDVDDARKIIGGLTSPSAIATMMIYELFKRTTRKVEKYV